MTEWQPVVVMPNVAPTQAVGSDVIAIAPQGDPRVKAVCEAHPPFRQFLEKFSDVFGEPRRPAVLIVRPDAGERVRHVDALAGFRDALAASVVPYSHARFLTRRDGGGFPHSNAFAFYPWMLDRAYRYLSMRVPGVHADGAPVESFRGQPSPDVTVRPLIPSDVDQPLFEALLARWIVAFTGPQTQRWEDRALFRALNMAYQAALPPAGNDAQIYDYGRVLAIWVSAFEILVHPGEGENSPIRSKVCDLLENKVKWISKDCTKLYQVTLRKYSKDCIPACRIYLKINDIRNDFLHGNAVSRDTLMLGECSVFQYAATLFRMALTGFLPVEFPTPIRRAAVTLSTKSSICPKSAGLSAIRRYLRARCSRL